MPFFEYDSEQTSHYNQPQSNLKTARDKNIIVGFRYINYAPSVILWGILGPCLAVVPSVIVVAYSAWLSGC